jgi:2-hydroxy-3-keto-5-methylthiopentenyl-1-phosphate phosphatase
MIKKLAVLITALLLVCGISMGCRGETPEKIAAEFTDLLDNATTTEDINDAKSFLLNKVKYLKDEQVGELLLHWENHALNLDNTSVDYNEIINEFKGHIPDYLRELLEFCKIEQVSPIISDAVIIVSLDELFDRTTKIENYIIENTDRALVKADALWLYRCYIGVLLMGSSNTPVFDYKTSEFSEELRYKMEEYLQNNPGTCTSEILTEYKKYLESIGYCLHYEDKDESPQFFDTCNRLISEAEKKVSLSGKGNLEKDNLERNDN